ncbi:thiamine biosynthesis lipoprotein [Micromonospora pattaloongensis]|uniref:FAD:protein FMN transferase n=1 Tax=Micromonospora pattaloongensis TaxID=405436 RepID=A0A1H3KWJ3_9ACTN|nr:FAD:protein FMN transferase [Micromonospora pattaloongensis]SDY56450.1 thiamine biosynthesis lipoprotein [Micromonospora pattaloongensis]
MLARGTTRTRRGTHPAYAADARFRPDLRIGPGGVERTGNPPAPGRGDRVIVRHAVHTSAADYLLMLIAPEPMSRRGLGEAIADAVAELRAIDVTYSPLRRTSLVALLRRGEVAPEAYPPLADIVARCDAMRAATDGWFDAWAVPGGFDPSGLLKGWAVERAAARLRAAGISDYAVVSGGDLTVRGHAPHGGPWRVAVHDPRGRDARPTVLALTEGAIGTSGMAGRRGHVVDPHTRTTVDQQRAAIVTGPDLAIADGYATALCAAGPAGLPWFPTRDGYRALFAPPR